LGFMVMDLGGLCSRIWRGNRVASSGRWSPRCAGCSGTYPSRSGGRGPPVPSATLICAMSRALERGLKPGVDGCLSTRTTYDQFSFSNSAVNLALVRFAVEKRNADWMIGGDPRRASDHADHRAVPVPRSPRVSGPPDRAGRPGQSRPSTAGAPGEGLPRLARIALQHL